MRHALDCGLCCGLAECDCGATAPRRKKLRAEHVALIAAVVALIAAYFVGIFS
jgi:hypothetical protein